MVSLGRKEESSSDLTWLGKVNKNKQLRRRKNQVVPLGQRKVKRNRQL